MLVAAFIIPALIALLFLPMEFIANAGFKREGVSVTIKAKLARVITLFGWDSGEEGLGFLVRKRKAETREKKKKKRLNALLHKIFNPKSIINIKRMSAIAFEVRGVIATGDAAGTALLYGAVCSLISILIPLVKFDRLITDFRPDFQEKHPDFHISCIINLRIIHIIYLIAEAIMDDHSKGRWRSLWNRILLRN
jgi:hypothetical protein